MTTNLPTSQLDGSSSSKIKGERSLDTKGARIWVWPMEGSLSSASNLGTSSLSSSDSSNSNRSLPKSEIMVASPHTSLSPHLCHSPYPHPIFKKINSPPRHYQIPHPHNWAPQGFTTTSLSSWDHPPLLLNG